MRNPSLSRKSTIIALCMLFVSTLSCFGATITGKITMVEVRLPEWGSDVNTFYTVTSTQSQGIKTFRIVTGTQNDKNTLATILTARSMDQQVVVTYQDGCTDYCNTYRVQF